MINPTNLKFRADLRFLQSNFISILILKVELSYNPIFTLRWGEEDIQDSQGFSMSALKINCASILKISASW